MNNAKKSIAKRLLAMCLSILMLFSVVPIAPIASAVDFERVDEDAFEIVVTDGRGVISDASVGLTNEKAMIKEKKATNADGIAAFPSITALRETIGDTADLDISYTVVAKGYKLVSGVFNLEREGGWEGKYEVVLERIPLEIPESDFSVKAYNDYYDGKTHDAVKVVAENYKVEYKVGEKDFTEEIPTLKNAGELELTVKLSRDGYNDKCIDVKATVYKADRDFSFEIKSPENLTYKPEGVTYTNAASSDEEPMDVVYSVDDSNIADIDSKTGELTLKNIGTVEVTATMPASDNYNESIAKYKITLVAADRDFGFTNDAPSDITYNPEDTIFKNEAINKENVGKIVYSIVSQERDGESVDDVATINPETGAVNIAAAGTIVVKAAVEAADNYKAAEKTYTLTVNRAKQEYFRFTEGDKTDLAYGSTYKNALAGGKSEGEITYEVTEERVTAGENVIEVDKDGNVKAVGIGSAVVVATKAGDKKYEEATAFYGVTTVKAQQKEFTLGDDKTVYYGTKELEVEATGNETEAEITYSLVFPDGTEEFAEFDEENGKIIFADRKSGFFTLKAENPGDAFYEKAEDECEVTVEEKDFSLYTTVYKTDGENGWYISDYKIVPNDGYKIGYSSSFDDETEWLDEIVISEEGVTDPFGYYIKEIETGYISGVITNSTIRIDKTNPTLKIEYSEHVSSWYNKLFYKDKVTVTITSEDKASGVKMLAYCIDGETTENVEMTYDPENKIYYFEMDIPAQYNGKVTANIVDFAGLRAAENDLIGDENDTELVVDNIAPNVTVSFNQDVESKGYLSEALELSVTVKEKNFYAEDVKISVERRNNDKTEFKPLNTEIEFKPVEGEKDTYVGKILFSDDADYRFDIAYTDKSGNVYDNFKQLEFTIDTIDPQIALSYKDGDKEECYNNNRVAVISVNEHNFSPELISLSTVGQIHNVDGTTSLVELSDYQKLLREAEWKHDGDIHVASVELKEEAIYSIALSCADMAGNNSKVINDTTIIDKSSPVNLKITYSKPVNENEWFYGNTVDVTLSAFDALSGVDEFIYSYTVAEGVSSVNKGAKDVHVKADENGEATVTIPAQFRGCVSFTAVDKAKNESDTFNDEKVVIVDNIAPGIDVVYDKNTFTNDKYLNENRKATIEINEANFWESDVEVFVNGVSEKLTFRNKIDENNNIVEDVFVAERLFDKDGDYVFSINYSDRSNNDAKYDSPEFVIDKTPPVISVSYSNNTVIEKKYFNANRTATVTVNEHNFNPANMDFGIKAMITEINEEGNLEETDVADVNLYAEYLKNPDNWTPVEGETDLYKCTLPEFNVDARYEISVNCTDLAGNAAASFEDNFIIDKTPAEDLVISYREPVNVIEKLFYNDKLEVTVSAFDGVSGIKSLDFTYGLEDNVSSKNVGGNKSVEYEPGVYMVSESKIIDSYFRGYLSLDVVNNVQMLSEKNDENVIVVDNIAPGVSAVITNNNVKNEKYYNDNRYAEVTVNEVNFWEEDVELIVYRQLDDETEYKLLDETYKFEPVEGEEDTYFAVVPFEENADYKFDIKYTDRSKNVYDKYDEVEFVVDKIKPEIYLEYENDSTPSNENNFNTNRRPVITVKEHNFDPKDIELEMTGVVTGDNGEIVTVVTEENGYLDYLRNPANWTAVEGEKDTYRISFDLNVDARYTISKLSYTDLAGNESDVITDAFVIDKASPENLTIIYKDTSWIDTLCEICTFGFYKDTTTVILKAEDRVSGLDYFTYSYSIGHCGSVDSADVSGLIGIPDENGEFKFEIDPQFRGLVSFSATDKANNTSEELIGDKVVVVDDKSPEVSVRFKADAPLNGNYYKAGRTAVITVKEANFWDEDIVITKYTRGDAYSNADAAAYTSERVEPEFNLEEGKLDTYVAEIAFEDNADYILDISYTDKSGNKADFVTNKGENKSVFEKQYFTVDKTAPEISIKIEPDAPLNGNHYKENRTATVTVIEHNFDSKDILCAVAGNTVLDNGVDLSSKKYTEYLRKAENWTSEGDTHTATIDFDIDAHYDVTISYADLAGNAVPETIEEDFVIDKVAPSGLEIEYAEKSVLDVVLEGITFGFYQAPAKVTLTALDEISGVDYITYSYTVSDSVSSVNKGKTDVVIPAAELRREAYPAAAFEGKAQYEKVTATFEMPAQFRGNVSFFATDRSGNVSEIQRDDKVIVVDNTAPVVKVEYDKYTENNHYTERTAIITIEEANFWADDVKITINRRLDTESEFTTLDYVPEFVKAENKEDTYKAVIKYNEFSANAEYIFDIEYTDKSGNKAKFVTGENKTVSDYAPDAFVVDVTCPEIKVSYNNNDVRYSDKFKADRTATIVITEHNFVPGDVDVTVTAKNLAGEAVEVEDYKAYLKNADSWTSEGDVHTAVIKFTEEADYTFGITYTDPAGNKNQTVDYDNSAAPEKFTIDKTVPVSAIKVGDWTKSKDGTKWNKFLNNVSFTLWENKAVKVTVESSDELSGLGTVEHFRSSEVLTLAQVKASTEWTKVENNKSEFSYSVEPDERFIVYVHVVDKSGNEIYLSSDGIILDETLPEIETIAPVVTVEPQMQPVNGIYSENVKVDVTVVDPVKATVYSGLKSITYEIYNNSVSVDEPTQTGTLFTYDITAKKQSDLVQKYEKSGCITVNREKNNSNDVTIKITAVDNSDNVTVSTRDIKIDTTAPVIDISYDNNSADSRKYFDANRIATIVVTERNFAPEDVVIEITNTDGKVPSVSSWKKTKGTGNLDDTKWTATVKYAADGDYTFNIAYTDKAGHKCETVKYAEGTVAAKAFTIDKTKPTVKVSYDNNSAANGNYYTAERVATVVINEHNFDSDRVKFSIVATDDGSTVASPRISSWKSEGDIRTCNIYYSADAKYDFDIDVTDKAGNASADYSADSFFVDKTDPEIEITNIENNSANSGKVAPVIRFSDTNFDRNNVKVVVNGSNRGPVAPIGSYSDIHNGVVFSFSNFAEEKSVDDIYTVSVSLTDKAGRTTSKSVTFSVNRFGSVYTLSKALTKIIDKYTSKAEDIVITETNPNRLSNIKLTLFKNGETIALTEGVDFKIDIQGGNGSWYRYVYTIFKNNFADDGVYSLSLHSEDSAGNIAENTLDTKNTEVNFGIDKTKPTINVKNVESNKTYALDIMKVNMSAKDNLSLKSVTVELDGKKYGEWTGDELKSLIDSGADMTFDISGDSTSAHIIKVIAVDEAGNEQVEEIKDFYVTTNLWVRYYTNKPLFYGSIAGVVLLAGAIVFFIVKKKKNDDK